jgi:hypothetical protein
LPILHVVSTDPIDELFGSGQPASELDSMPAMTFQTISPIGIMITPTQKTIGWASTGGGQGVRAGAGHLDAEALAAQVHAEQVGDGTLVLDDQDQPPGLRAHVPHPARSRSDSCPR